MKEKETEEEEVKEQLKNIVKEKKKLVGKMEERKTTAEEHEVSHTTGK